MENNIIWKPIDFTDGNYEVSNTGLIRSIDRISYTEHYSTKGRFYKGRILKLSLNNSGYYLVFIAYKGVRFVKLVHRLVADAFLPNPSNKTQVNHINGIKTDNRLDNLEWVTPKENSIHSWENGLMENSREKARIRMSIIGKKFANINGKRLKENYAGSNQYNRKSL